jgi:protein O-GlcNAc transferase
MSLLVKFARDVTEMLRGRRGVAALSTLLDRAAQADARGQHVEAEHLSREALAVAPDSAAAWMSLGLALQLQRRLAEACEALTRAVELAPNSAGALYNLGRAHYACGDYRAAASVLGGALRAAPQFVDALILLADALAELGDSDLAITTLHQALEIEPRNPGALNNCALLLTAAGRLDEALEMLRRAVEVSPNQIEPRRGLVIALSDLARSEQALAAGKATLDAHPESHAARSLYLFMLLHSDQLTMDQIAAEHRRVGRLFDEEVPRRATAYGNSRDPARRLRVGYVSGDLRAHSVAVFIEPVLERHDHVAFEPIAYSDVTKPDAFTRRMRPMFTTWRDIAGLDDAAVARLVEDDAIDVLVDLSGHTSASRLGVFARQPAPVQVSWLGYINSTGLSTINYRFSDAVLDPPGTADGQSSEHIVRLPKTYWCYRPPLSIEAGATSTASGRGFRFGSFNRYSKVSDTTIALWGRLMHAVPGSRLVVVTVPVGPAQNELLKRLENAGVARERVELAARLEQHQYFAHFDRVDLCIDTTPYSGATTTCDALWMGVPVVTLRGATPISRSAASVLTGAGLTEWIAETPKQFVDVAAALALTGPRGPGPRAALRQEFETSAVMDEHTYTRDVERAYRWMWTQWCNAGARDPLR